MKLYIMKQSAMETLKANLTSVWSNYYSEPDNGWIKRVLGEDPFEEFREVEDFTLADLNGSRSAGEIDLSNCKIVYGKLSFLSEAQACDERLWAGLAHSTFYDYMKKRHRYVAVATPKDAQTEAGSIKSRFFFSGSGRGGFYRNTLSKCWWVGSKTYNPDNPANPFESLDIIGANDFSSKVNELFRSYSFSSNPVIMAGIIDALRPYSDSQNGLLVREQLRSALSYLNAAGGTTVLDCLEKGKITEIMSYALKRYADGE